MKIILDKLKTIFQGKFGDILSNNVLNLNFSKNISNVLEVKELQKVSLDITKADEIEKQKIKEEILDYIVQKQSDLFLTNNTTKKTTKIKRNLPKDEDKSLLDFYKDKLKPEMYKALEMSLVVRRAHKREEDISELKRDIAFKYPEFGNNLCNLVTGDYFHKYFKELYNNMFVEDNFDISKYQEEVERIVKSLPYMVFINRYKSYEEFSGEVKFKLDKLREYGTKKLKLHGLGRDNVETVLKIVEDYKYGNSIEIDPEINSSKTRITVTFTFLKV